MIDNQKDSPHTAATDGSITRGGGNPIVHGQEVTLKVFSCTYGGSREHVQVLVAHEQSTKY